MSVDFYVISCYHAAACLIYWRVFPFSLLSPQPACFSKASGWGVFPIPPLSTQSSLHMHFPIREFCAISHFLPNPHWLIASFYGRIDKLQTKLDRYGTFMKKEQTRTSFKSRWGFILASVGSAVGMANVWGFPNKMGSNGGGAFLLIYLLFIFCSATSDFQPSSRSDVGRAQEHSGPMKMHGVRETKNSRLPGVHLAGCHSQVPYASQSAIQSSLPMY